MKIKLILLLNAIFFIAANSSEKKDYELQKSVVKNLENLNNVVIAPDNYLKQAINTPGFTYDLQNLVAQYAVEISSPEFQLQAKFDEAINISISQCGKYLACHFISWELPGFVSMIYLTLIKISTLFLKKIITQEDFILFEDINMGTDSAIIKFSPDSRYLFFESALNEDDSDDEKYNINKYDIVNNEYLKAEVIDRYESTQDSACGNYVIFNFKNNPALILDLDTGGFIDKFDCKARNNNEILKNKHYLSAQSKAAPNFIELKKRIFLLNSIKNCINCQKEESKKQKNFSCQNCKSVYYCSKACQDFDLERHKEHCKSKQT